MPGPSSVMSTSAQLPSRRVVTVIVPCSPSAWIALWIRFVHTWLSSRAADRELRQRVVVVAHDLERLVLELVLEDAQGRVDPLVQVDLDELAAVHVGVGLDRLHEVGHLRRRLLELARQRRGRSASPRPTRSAARVAGPASSATRSSHAWSTPAPASGSARRHGSAIAEVLEAVEELVLGVGGVERVELASARRGRARAWRGARRARRVGALDARLDEAADRPADDLERLDHLRGRALRGGGGVVELVREAGRQLAERGEPLAVLLDRR